MGAIDQMTQIKHHSRHLNLLKMTAQSLHQFVKLFHVLFLFFSFFFWFLVYDVCVRPTCVPHLTIQVHTISRFQRKTF
jgi:hypothetical protein